tara:strand:- start:4107 stop:5423 length:1317 start_codon:yes stop_codon:yes gene_type:complete
VRSILTSLWAYVIAGLLAFYVLLYVFLDLPSRLEDIPVVNPLRTLLGALAAGLITAQALVFTITLVAAQLNARYTHRMVTRVFTWPTALYMGLFVGSSVYSMVVLAALSTRPSDFVIHLPVGRPIHPVTVAVALGGTCLVLLVPYLWSFRTRLDPERMALDEGRRASARLKAGAATEPREVIALDNITMSAFGYKDYDTFATGVQALARVGLDAWQLSRADAGKSIFRRLAHVGVATVDDPRAPFQVVDALAGTGSALVERKMHEAARQAAVAMSDIAEAAVERSQASAIGLVVFSLSALGSQAAELGLVATAEETAYSLGYLGAQTSQRGLADSTRQVASSLRRVGTQAAKYQLDLVVRQALISLWSLGALTSQHLPECDDVVAAELEMLELVVDPELAASSYLSTPRSPNLEDFRIRYLAAAKPNGAIDDSGQADS